MSAMESTGRSKPTISVQKAGCSSRLLGSPSRDSVTTEVGRCLHTKLSLSSLQDQPMGHRSPALRVSFRSGDNHFSRGPSPSPNLSDRLLVPSATHRARSPSCKSVKDIWLDEENDLIRSCGALSKALGLQKSFSTSDILTGADLGGVLRQSRSEMFLLEATNIHWTKLEANSRSLSTWVAVGDVQSSTSQLPSPQVESNKGFPESEYGVHFTAADFVRSVNKKVRQNYIRKRLKVTYRALEQLAETGFDLDRLEREVRKSQTDSTAAAAFKLKRSRPAEPGVAISKMRVTVNSDLGIADVSTRAGIVSPKEIERDRGKPISKYERNMMIFDWLHTLDPAVPGAAAYELA